MTPPATEIPTCGGVDQSRFPAELQRVVTFVSDSGLPSSLGRVFPQRTQVSFGRASPGVTSRLGTLALFSVLGACGVDDYRFVPDDEGGPAAPTTQTVCGSDADCADF